MLQATIANVNRGKGQRPYTGEQFTPKWGVMKPTGPMTGEDMLRAVKKANKAMGGRVEGGNAGGPASPDRR